MTIRERSSSLKKSPDAVPIIIFMGLYLYDIIYWLFRRKFFRKRVSISLYQILKRDRAVVSFDINKISKAIQKAFEEVSKEERKVDHEIDQILESLYEDIDVSYYQDELYKLEEKRREIRKYRKRLRRELNTIMRITWMTRNKSVGRSKASAVSDMMLLTVPTPPTFETANSSLQKWGIEYGAVA